MVKSRDGKTDIPVNVVYRKDVMEKHLADGKPVHTHLYGYGSYEACMEASFSATRLTLLDRGIVYAIAQIRGGGEMGRKYFPFDTVLVVQLLLIQYDRAFLILSIPSFPT